MALWVRLPGLPPEFYDLKTLTRIGNLLGWTLKVDAHTTDAARGQYARICVQVPIDKPLITVTALGHHTQRIIYEGINQICFSCGKIGHKSLSCPEFLRSPPTDQHAQSPTDNTPGPSSSPNHTPPSTSEQSSSMHGPWMVVQRKKNLNFTKKTVPHQNTNISKNFEKASGKEEVT